MSSYNWEETMKKEVRMKDADFEALLEECVPELPPVDVVKEVTPWKKAMNRILWGMGLTTITLNFWNLDYILPFIGMFLMLFGFRVLREENKWFNVCWRLMLFRITYFVFVCILDATIYRSMLEGSNINLVLIVIGFGIVFIQIFCFGKAIRMVQKKAGVRPRAKAANVLLIWFVIMCYLGAMQYAGILVYVLLIGYICIIRSLHKLSKELVEVGYAIEPAQIKVSEQIIIAGVLGIMAVGISCGYVFFHSYPMDWQPAVVSEDAKITEIKEHLIEIGFPKNVLADLTEEDILACEGALRVVTDVNDHPVNEGRVVMEETVMGFHQYMAYDRKELRFTHIAVELPGEIERWKVFHHFEFIFHPGFYGTESIQLWSCYRNYPDAWAPEGEVTGQVLYDMDGQTFVAPYASLKERSYQSYNFMFTGMENNMDVFADFSMPDEGSRHRGYVSYTTAEVKDGVRLTSWVNYSHQNSWLQYPVLSATEKRMQDNMARMEPFKTVYDQISFYPFRDSIVR